MAINDQDITSLTMARTENDQTNPTTAYDVTTVSYLGYAPGGLVPGGPPGPSCHSTTVAATSSAEANKFGGAFQVAYGNQYGVRPTAIATYTSGTQMLSFSVCGYSESEQARVRVDSANHITKMGSVGTENDGTGVLYLGAGAPTSGGIDINGDGVIDSTTDGTSCATTGSFAYHYLTKSYTRDARTDFPGLSKNSGIITADTNGPAGGKGTQVADTADGAADDWDGDGCPDWDELDKGYMPTSLPLGYPPSYTWSATPVSGMDPFNPADCDLNFTSTISLTTTIVHNTGAGATTTAVGCTFAQIIGNTCPNGNGQYFRCLGSVNDAKTGTTHALSYRLGCYSDSTVTAVNNSYPDAVYDASLHEGGGAGPATCGDGIDNDSNGKKDAADSSCHDNTCPPDPVYLCGDGKGGQPPGGCLPNFGTPTWCSSATAPNCSLPLPCAASRFVYNGIDPASYPVVANDPANNYFDPAMNQIHLGGCFAGCGGGTFGNVYGSSTIDAHTGVGSFQIYLNQPDNCTGSPCTTSPCSGPINGQIEIVELRTEKGLPTDCAGSSSDCHKYDSDRDGCADARELLSSQGMGGERDPYNPNDFFNPEKTTSPDTQGTVDILKVKTSTARARATWRTRQRRTGRRCQVLRSGTSARPTASKRRLTSWRRSSSTTRTVLAWRRSAAIIANIKGAPRLRRGAPFLCLPHR